MNHILKAMAILGILLALLSLSGCQEPPKPTAGTTQMSTDAPLTAHEQYLYGRESIDNASNWILRYTIEQKRIVGEDVYVEKISGNASFSRRNQAGMTAVIEEQLEFGGYDCDYSEVYCGGIAHVQVNSSNFKAEMDPESFEKRYIPAVLLDGSLYQSALLTKMENSTVISFSNPTGLEKWLSSETAVLVDASGTAALDSTGVLRQTTYWAVYTQGKTTYEVTASVDVTAPQVLELGAAHQEHIRGSVELTDLDVPKMLLQVVGNVYSAGQIRCEAAESVFSEAIPLSYTQNSLLELSGEGDKLFARAEYDVSMSDYRGEATASSWVEKYENGKFSTTAVGADTGDVTADRMRQYFEDAILSALAAPIYLRDARVVDEGNAYRIEITGNNAFITDMMANIGQFLQVDLDKRATQSKTLTARGYVTVEKETGLPGEMGIYLEREHVIETVTYQLAYRLEHTLSLSGS